MNTLRKSEIAWSLWLPVIGLFALVSIVWFITIRIAHENPTEVIEVETPRN